MSPEIDPIIPVEDRVRGLQDILIRRATGGSFWGGADGSLGNDAHDYALLRRDLLRNPELGSLLPRFVSDCRDLDQFWAYIRGRFSHYDERRAHIWQAFEPVFARLEGRSVAPADLDVSATLKQLSGDAVHEVWEKALRRRAHDPEGAITMARTLLETVCKLILEREAVPFDDSADLSKLYGLTAQRLNLAPDQHSEQVFKQILGGCKTIVDGLGALRNRLGDAHGKAPARGRPQARHAELAVNLAGAAATFLVQTWRGRNPAG